MVRRVFYKFYAAKLITLPALNYAVAWIWDDSTWTAWFILSKSPNPLWYVFYI